jgi:hypothetical protein
MTGLAHTPPSSTSTPTPTCMHAAAGMLNAMRAKGSFGEKSSDAGYIGLGIMMVGLGIDSIAGGGKDETAWMFYDLEKVSASAAPLCVCVLCSPCMI